MRHFFSRTGVTHAMRTILVFAAVSVAALPLLRLGGGGQDLSRGADSQGAGKLDRARHDEARRRFSEGVALLTARRFEQAIVAFHRVLVIDHTIPEAHINMGFALYELGRWQRALDHFGKALTLGPEQANAHYGRSLALIQLGEYSVARAAMLRFLELAGPDDRFRERAAAWLSLINAQDAAGKHQARAVQGKSIPSGANGETN